MSREAQQNQRETVPAVWAVFGAPLIGIPLFVALLMFGAADGTAGDRLLAPEASVEAEEAQPASVPESDPPGILEALG